MKLREDHSKIKSSAIRLQIMYQDYTFKFKLDFNLNKKLKDYRAEKNYQINKKIKFCESAAWVSPLKKNM